MSFVQNVRENLRNICQNWEEGERRNFVSSAISGTLFFLGWWIIFDASANYKESMNDAYHVCGVIATIAMIMVNCVSNEQLRGDSYTDGCFGPYGAKIWMFVALLMSFSSLIGSCWILFGVYVVPKLPQQWPGLAIFLQNMFIFMSSLIYKFGRVEE